MKSSEGRPGRVFVLRLEDGDVVPGCIESFARENAVHFGQVTLVGGIGRGEIVVGPRDSGEARPQAMTVPVDGAHEVLAVGLLAPDASGNPVLHMHGALGRSGQAVVGCLRPGVATWLVAEAIIWEITGIQATRKPDVRSGFTLLEI
jgi:uncharacterized protein